MMKSPEENEEAYTLCVYVGWIYACVRACVINISKESLVVMMMAAAAALVTFCALCV